MGEIFLGWTENGERQVLGLGRANRHGLIAGATGTGKTVTLQGLAESFSAAGVPVFVADVKGDLAGIAMPGSPTFKHADKLEARAAELGMTDYAYADNPVVFWDLYGEQGHPIRTTVSEMGPLLLSRLLLGSTRRRKGVLNIASASPTSRACCCSTSRTCRRCWPTRPRTRRTCRPRSTATSPRPASARSSGSCCRSTARAAALSSASRRWKSTTSSRCDEQGRGYINVLAADRLMRSPKLYATFLLWLLPSCSRACPRSATRKSRSWCSSSTRRTCCSTMRPGRCRTRSSRSCA
jgi:uncharacterized protein